MDGSVKNKPGREVISLSEPVDAWPANSTSCTSKPKLVEVKHSFAETQLRGS